MKKDSALYIIHQQLYIASSNDSNQGFSGVVYSHLFLESSHQDKGTDCLRGDVTAKHHGNDIVVVFLTFTYITWKEIHPTNHVCDPTDPVEKLHSYMTSSSTFLHSWMTLPLNTVDWLLTTVVFYSCSCSLPERIYYQCPAIVIQRQCLVFLYIGVTESFCSGFCTCIVVHFIFFFG